MKKEKEYAHLLAVYQAMLQLPIDLRGNFFKPYLIELSDDMTDLAESIKKDEIVSKSKTYQSSELIN